MAKQSNLKTFITAMIVIVVFGAVTVFVTSRLINEREDGRIISIPTIRANFGQHFVEVRMDVMLSNDANRVDSRSVAGRIEQIMGGLDFERLNEADSLDYVQGEIIAGIASYVGGAQHVDVFISDFGVDISLAPDPRDNFFEQRPFGWTTR